MWLIDTETFRLVFHHECPQGKYAILSHTWEDDEVSFQDFKDLTSARLKKGFAKIDSTVRKARNMNYKWAWVDTCCIDKSSSAELSEAINSMYQWYQKSAICYAFLSDLPSGSGPRPKAFRECRWWKRGWTLQELIAPKRLRFYDQDWNKYGGRLDLGEELKSITGIPIAAYTGPLSNFSVAQRMSWASDRETTRTEDIAYCLLGLFDVNMPLIYGEGEKAFIRLQEEICKMNRDLTVFAWTIQPPPKTDLPTQPAQSYRGLLASHPAEFSGSGSISRTGQRRQWNHDQKVTSVGNQDIDFDGVTLLIDEGPGILMPIGRTEMTTLGSVGIYISLKKKIGGYVRSLPDRLAGDIGADHSSLRVGEIFEENSLKLLRIDTYNHPGTLHLPHSSLSLPKRLTHQDSLAIDKLYEEALFIDADSKFKIMAAYPKDFWAPDERAFLMDQELAGAILMKVQHPLATSNKKQHSLILLVDCLKSSDKKRLERLEFRIVGTFNGGYERRDEEDDYSRILDLIRETKLTTYDSFVEVRLAINAMNRGGWDQEHDKFWPSTWKFRGDGSGIRAEIDSEQFASGKAILRLRLSD